jgi:carbonic anhydrase
MNEFREDTCRADQPRSLLPSATRFAILTCMDARIDPTRLAALRGSHAHVIRNAGARASDDAIRSLVLSHRLFGTREWCVVQHSHCGMALLSDEIMQSLLTDGPNPVGAHSGTRAGSRGSNDAGLIGRLTIQDQEHSVAADVLRIRKHPRVPPEIAIYGYIYQVEADRFVEVVADVSTSFGREVAAALR